MLPVFVRREAHEITPILKTLLLLVWLGGVPLARGQVQSAVDMGGAGDAQAPLVITLRDAIERAKANDPKFRGALTELGLAHQDVVQSRAGLLPNVNYNMGYIYTQGGGNPDFAGGRYIANNGVHEYIAQGNVHQNFSAGMIAEHRAVEAAEALARAKAEVATRGLVVTVVEAYDSYVIAQRKYANSQRATAEADHFLDISQNLEKGGEVANSDVIKAKIQAQQQHRGLQDAALSMNKSRLDLAVLLFPDFDENFSVVDDLATPEPLPSFPEVSAAATKNNPEVRAAMAALRQSDQQVKSAWAGMLPSLEADYFYGIDANQLAARDPNGFHNLGYSATAALQLPVWNWGSSYSKIKQAGLRRELAHVELSAVQRQLLANLKADYAEAQTSREELDSLRQSAELAAESLRLTTLRYQAGESSVLEVVDAQNTLTQARNAYDDGQLRFQVAMANLQTLTGSF